MGLDKIDGSGASAYLSRQLIAYIGNKRRLLEFLRRAFVELGERRRIRAFADPFAGSGAVSRLAKSLGYEVSANDWELYAWVVCAAHLGIDRSTLPRLFRDRGGIDRVLGELNALGRAPAGPGARRGYIARHYAPAVTERADYRRERLFYTAENGGFIDRVRERIEQWYPGWQLDGDALSEKLLLVAPLLYEAATHANTSGVFKACHKGFGGFGRDALRRIMSPMELECPLLIDGAEAHVERRNAAEFLAGATVDLCYLDPPYNVHQYGSNYHLLTTIARWDKPPVDESLGPDGRLTEKAAIRKDWVETRSDFCSADRAAGAFEALFDRIDARYICLSYNTEGIVPFERLYDLAARHGKVEIVGTDYVQYRGGKQSMFRRVHNLELLLVVTRGVRARRADSAAFRRFMLEQQVRSHLRAAYVPLRVAAELERSPRGIRVTAQSGRSVELAMNHHYRFTSEARSVDLSSFGSGELADLGERLARCQCRSREEEARVLFALLAEAEREDERADEPESAVRSRERVALQGELARSLRKFAHRRYRSEFEQMASELRALIRLAPERYGRLARELAEVERVASLRFAG